MIPHHIGDKMRKIKIIIILLISLTPVLLPAWTNWQTLKTRNFSIFYQPGWDTEAINVLQTMEYYRPYAESLTGNTKQHVSVNLQDIGNLVNGYTDPIGNRIALFAFPPTNDELALCDDWWQLVGTHEYIHMLQLTSSGGIPHVLQMALGNILYPQLHQPMWMTEGITVFGEAQLSPFTGRLNSGSFRPIISALAQENRLPSLTKAAYYSYDTPLAHYYVFGGSFYDYLAQTYGKDRFARLFADNSSRPAAYLNGLFPALALDRSFQKVYTRSLPTLWKDWQQAELAKPFTMPSRNLTSTGWNTSELKYYKGELYFINSQADKTAPSGSFFAYQLKKFSPSSFQSSSTADAELTGMISPDTTLVTQNTEFSAGYGFANDMLYYTRLESQTGFANTENDGYGYITQLWQMDMTDRTTRMLHAGQFRAFYPLEDGSFLLSEDAPDHRSSTLVNILPCCKERTELLKTDLLISGIIADSSRVFITARDYWKNSSIYEYDAQSHTLIPVIDTPYWEALTSIAGDILTFNAVYDGQMGAYQYDLFTRQFLRYTGFSDIRNPVSTSDARDYFISVNAEGYDVYRDDLALQPYVLPQTAYPTPPYPRLKYTGQTSVLDGIPVTRGNYLDNLRHMAVPRMLHVPFVQGTGDSLSFGLSLSGNDAVGDFPSWQANLLYDTYYSRMRYSLTLQNDFFHPVHQQFYYSNLDDQTLSATQYSTLYKSVNYGLNNINAGLGITTRDDYARKVWNPYTDIDFSWITGQLHTRNSLYYETPDWLPSDRNRLGWQGFYQFRQKTTRSSEFQAGLNVAYDPDADNDEVFYRLRGYENGLRSKQGATLRTTWYHPIFQIREGLWNPQIYVEDVSLGLFFDAGLPFKHTSDASQLSTGMELISELGMFYYLNLNAGVRVAVNRDSAAKVELIFSTGL